MNDSPTSPGVRALTCYRELDPLALNVTSQTEETFLISLVDFASIVPGYICITLGITRSDDATWTVILAGSHGDSSSGRYAVSFDARSAWEDRVPSHVNGVAASADVEPRNSTQEFAEKTRAAR